MRAPVVQRIERIPPKDEIEVRFPAGAPKTMTSEKLIKKAESVLNPHKTAGGSLFGDVGAALITEQGNVYTGVAVDTGGWGLCAERSAIAAMVTAGEYRIKKIVAVWRDEKSGKLYALAPCGICREFIRSIDHDNLETEFIIGKGRIFKLKELLPHPFHEWPDPLN